MGGDIMTKQNFHGSFVLVLHAHLPYVLHQNRLEEEMLFEATAETYIPLLEMFNKLVDEGVSPKVTIGISPVLAEQLTNSYFKYKFREYCLLKMQYALQDQNTFRNVNEHISGLARMWEEFYSRTYTMFMEKYNEDLLSAFKKLQDEGHIEIITCGATHAYFPALREDTSIQAQVKMAVKTHQRHFGKKPRGIWLPECGYRPPCDWSPPFTSDYGETPYPRKGVEEFLSENDITYFVIDAHQLMRAWPNDIFKSPMETYLVGGAQIPKKPVTVFTRDIKLSAQVWWHQVGYPGDAAYLDFHKRHEGSKHRYWRITDNRLDMAYKELYYPDDSYRHRVKEHAGHYKWLIAQSLKSNYQNTGTATLAMTAFDAELFGHWWFEGPTFLYYVIKWIAADPETKSATCSEYLDQNPADIWVHLHESSWGRNYDSSTWINPEVEWTWERIYHAEKEIQYLAKDFASRKNDQTLQRILKQAIRELFILQASDWQFMITNWSTRDLAEKRVVERHEDFIRLAKMAWDYGHGRNVPEEEWVFLHHCEMRNDVFPEPELGWFSKLDYPPKSKE
ncbi:DUF1957 domain-containing protein [Candidatus Poribacteria bacterium]|nr:DUF1957 domain-containing protein [Candidatus Poribacteria bacterium]